MAARTASYSPRTCRVCHHPARLEIDRRLIVERDSLASLAREFGFDVRVVQEHQKRRHHSESVVSQVLKSKQEMTQELVSEIDALIDSNKRNRNRAEQSAAQHTKLTSAAFLNAALKANSNLNANIKTKAEILEIINHSTVINLALIPEWNEIAKILYDICEEFPPIRERLKYHLFAVQKTHRAALQ